MCLLLVLLLILVLVNQKASVTYWYPMKIFGALDIGLGQKINKFHVPLGIRSNVASFIVSN